MTRFSQLDSKKFTIAIPDEAQAKLKTLIELSPLPPPTYESSRDNFGVTREWMESAIEAWKQFDWEKTQAHMNRYPNYNIPVAYGDGRKLEVHFIGLFSEKASAPPILLSHGWPGSVLEFLPLLDLLTSKYPSPKDLPCHFVIPSLPGYGWSEAPSVDRDFGLQDASQLLDQLMQDLGFDTYVAHGGDIGAYISRYLGAHMDSCKAIHLTYCPVINPPKDFDMATLTQREKEGLERGHEFVTRGSAYAVMHATRPSTAGYVLTNPISLLAWVGEKMLAWTDKDLPIDTTLAEVSLYFLTNTAATSLWPYRQTTFHPEKVAEPDQPSLYVKKPMGFSDFPKEILPCPKSWVATTGNLVFYREHSEGGHFVGWEATKALWEDLEAFVEQIWVEEK